MSASASFTDLGVVDTHTAVTDWGDGTTSAGAVEETVGSGSVAGTHSYGIPGVYQIILTVTDKDGATGQAVFEYVVVYDANGGFVTGGGWITSPLGAYVPNPNLTGKATFGFVSKYLNGANIPTGNTQFVFHAADMNFKSKTYEWLVVAGARAQFKGEGTINGAGSYGFLLTAIDGQQSGGGGVDRIRIKIWDKAGGQIVYDNQMGADDNGSASTALGGGSIVIQK